MADFVDKKLQIPEVFCCSVADLEHDCARPNLVVTMDLTCSHLYGGHNASLIQPYHPQLAVGIRVRISTSQLFAICCIYIKWH